MGTCARSCPVYHQPKELQVPLQAPTCKEERVGPSQDLNTSTELFNNEESFDIEPMKAPKEDKEEKEEDMIPAGQGPF